MEENRYLDENDYKFRDYVLENILNKKYISTAYNGNPYIDFRKFGWNVGEKYDG